MLTTRDPQRGSAMLVTLILIAAMLAGIGVLVALQLASTRSTELTRDGMSALHCAEAGLASSHNLVGTNRSAITSYLSTSQTIAAPVYTTSNPVMTALTAANLLDIDGDGAADFQVFIIDNDDGGDYTTDSDSRVFLISRCIKYPDNQKQVMELIEFPATPTMYDWQEGRGFGNNNGNAY